MKGLGRVPAGFKEHHVCGECKEFKPLWDLAYEKWCDDCVRNNGGLLAAGEIARARWQAEIDARRAAREASRPELTLVERGKPAAGQPRNASLMARAQALHKAMKCTAEEAYDRLVAAEEAKNR